MESTKASHSCWFIPSVFVSLFALFFITILPIFSYGKSQPDSACFMKLADKWEIDKDLPANALLVSLQGIVNKKAPNIYFIYPKNWPYTFTQSILDYYQTKRKIHFTEIDSLEQALDLFHQYVKGYIVWDKSVRTSLVVAFTLSGLENAVVVSEEYIPLAEKYGLKPIHDFRGQFKGMNDYQIYKWAYDNYWDRCSKDFIVYMGGVYGNKMQAGIADFGIYKHAFFTDLSCNPKDTVEYRFANKLFSEMHPMSMMLGWHSYKKDSEGQFATLTSHYGMRIEGLNTMPNLSFNNQIPITKGYKFKNNHYIKPGKKYKAKKKIYVACIQTDGLGIGAWLKPGRGEIPYAWEVPLNWIWLAPAMLQYFYDMATPKDYFIGALSGPGYMYPKAVPRKYLPKLVAKAYKMMKQLDLEVFETMDYSQGNRYVGNVDLPKDIVDVYYKNMPGAIGFINGYGAANTRDIRNGKPFLSYEYYLSPTRQDSSVVEDLQELMVLNKIRPYFLLIHVRESSDIKRVKTLLDTFGNKIELVPLDVFLKLSASNPTFKTRFLDDVVGKN
ncbi:MAG: hypothetical protein GXO75_04835 [Calditrichaeota bacterium]|nr:hypothetical protein [Calditrichota bacterium]